MYQVITNYVYYVIDNQLYVLLVINQIDHIIFDKHVAARSAAMALVIKVSGAKTKTKKKIIHI